MAGPLRRAPRIAAEADEDLLTLKQGRLFMCSGWNGDISPGRASGAGLYLDDTRYLSELRLEVAGRTPLLLASSAGQPFEAVMDLTNPALTDAIGRAIGQLTLEIRRRRVLAERAHERVEIRNYSRSVADVSIDVALGADFADVFEIRGVHTPNVRGRLRIPVLESGILRFSYEGTDGLRRDTVAAFDPPPDSSRIGRGRAILRWQVHLEPKQAVTLNATFDPAPGGSSHAGLGLEHEADLVSAESSRWRKGCATISADQESVGRLVEASLRDLHALQTPSDGGEVLAAGIPWYVAPFGRDSVLACYETLMVNSRLARSTLEFLARHQAVEDDPSRDAEPGKVLHELRVGELARSGQIPHTPYYGSVDATPLFLMLASAYYRWTNDLEVLGNLRPHLDAALGWIDRFGDRDGDGFVEYQRRSKAGLDSQGWKDSEDAILHADGTRAEPPIALVEVQGYVHLAKRGVAEVYEGLGDPDTAERLRKEADTLREAFDASFWMPEEGFYALALDGSKRQVKSVSSNPGHALFCDIVPKNRAGAVAERLMAPDMMSGWGIRTLSAEHPAYNPMSYHNGSVWPHDNAIAAAGLKHYGFAAATERIATSTFDVAMGERDLRVPELFCGFNRRPDIPVVQYPVACRPQAWAAAAFFMLVQSMLGISANAPDHTLLIDKPGLPPWIDTLQLRNLQIGDARIGLRFSREGATTSFDVLHQDGELDVAART